MKNNIWSEGMVMFLKQIPMKFLFSTGKHSLEESNLVKRKRRQKIRQQIVKDTKKVNGR